MGVDLINKLLRKAGGGGGAAAFLSRGVFKPFNERWTIKLVC